ncbi:MAG: hypothetical protein P4M11_04030 [Candidatus Pacebacteria bacterium]|nr:hypothetical protein [Candidatus Paceibacterota bacterium]
MALETIYGIHTIVRYSVVNDTNITSTIKSILVRLLFWTEISSWITEKTYLYPGRTSE